MNMGPDITSKLSHKAGTDLVLSIALDGDLTVVRLSLVLYSFLNNLL